MAEKIQSSKTITDATALEALKSEIQKIEFQRNTDVLSRSTLLTEYFSTYGDNITSITQKIHNALQVTKAKFAPLDEKISVRNSELSVIVSRKTSLIKSFNALKNNLDNINMIDPIQNQIALLSQRQKKLTDEITELQKDRTNIQKTVDFYTQSINFTQLKLLQVLERKNQSEMIRFKTFSETIVKAYESANIALQTEITKKKPIYDAANTELKNTPIVSYDDTTYPAVSAKIKSLKKTMSDNNYSQYQKTIDANNDLIKKNRQTLQKYLESNLSVPIDLATYNDKLK